MRRKLAVGTKQESIGTVGAAQKRVLVGLALVGALAVVLLALPPVRQLLSVGSLYFTNDGTPASWHGEATSVSLPFEHEILVLLPVRVNGGPTLRFVLDTGAPFPGLIGGPRTDGLDLELGRRLVVGGSGSGATTYGRVVRDLDFALGSVELAEQTAVLIPWQELGMMFSAPEEVFLEGIIGYDLLRRYVVELDFEQEKMTLHRPAGFRYAGDGEVLELTFTQRKPYTLAEVSLDGGDGIPVKLHVDLGHRSTLSLIPGSKPEITVPEDTVESAGFGLSGRVEKLTGRVRELRLGGQVLRDVICSFTLSGHATAGQRQGVLGLEVLSRFRVILDYPGKRMILERTAATDRPFESDMSGAGFLPSGATYVLRRLRSESPASAAGLREGDLLVSIDGTPAEELRWRDLERRLRAGDSKRVELEVRRAGTVIAAELTLRRRM